MIVILAGSIAFAFQGSRGIYERTEGRYAECARQSRQAGDLDDPVLNGEYHWSKPPLIYYCIAGGIKLFGNNAWGARIHLSLAFLITILALYYLGLQLWGRDAAPFCALIYATAPFTIIASSVLTTDTLLVMWQTLSILFFWLAVRRKRKIFIVLMWFCFGLAHLTKGPPALMPLCGIIPTYFLLKQQHHDIPSVFSLFGIATFITVGLGWYISEVLEAEHPGLLQYWVREEILGRNVGGDSHRNPQLKRAFQIYLPILVFGTGQWIIFLFLKRKDMRWTAEGWLRRAGKENRIEWSYLALSFFIPLIIFSLSKSKLPLYVLPLFVPLSLAMGKAITRLISDGKVGIRTVLAIACCATLLFISIKACSAHVNCKHNMAVLARNIKPIIKSYPNHKLYHTWRHSLNGLQFYIDELIPEISLAELDSVLNKDRIAGTVPIVITRTRPLKEMEKTIDPEIFEILMLDKYWSLIIPRI